MPSFPSEHQDDFREHKQVGNQTEENEFENDLIESKAIGLERWWSEDHPNRSRCSWQRKGSSLVSGLAGVDLLEPSLILF
jgi:hypothetical protein